MTPPDTARWTASGSSTSPASSPGRTARGCSPSSAPTSSSSSRPVGDQTGRGRGASRPSPPGFVQLNLGKRLIAVDLGQAEGSDLVRRLAGAVDVLIENFRPGVMEAWGLDYASLAAEHPALIYVSISGYGQTGDVARAAGLRPVRPRRGRATSTRPRSCESAAVEHDPMSIADLAAAKDATIALLAALVQRGRTGRGQHIDISLAHSILFLNEFASTLLTPGHRPPKSGSTPQAIFTTSDGGRFSAGNPVSGQVFATLCRSFGCPELIDDPRFIDSGGRRQRRAELLAELQAGLLELGGIDEVEAVLNAAGLAVGRIRGVVDVPATAWAVERGAIVTADVDGGRRRDAAERAVAHVRRAAPPAATLGAVRRRRRRRAGRAAGPRRRGRSTSCYAHGVLHAHPRRQRRAAS